MCVDTLTPSTVPLSAPTPLDLYREMRVHLEESTLISPVSLQSASCANAKQPKVRGRVARVSVRMRARGVCVHVCICVCVFVSARQKCCATGQQLTDNNSLDG